MLLATAVHGKDLSELAIHIVCAMYCYVVCVCIGVCVWVWVWVCVSVSVCVYANKSLSTCWESGSRWGGRRRRSGWLDILTQEWGVNYYYVNPPENLGLVTEDPIHTEIYMSSYWTPVPETWIDYFWVWATCVCMYAYLWPDLGKFNILYILSDGDFAIAIKHL